MRGTAYAEAKAVEIRRAETLRDRLQTVVPGIAPSLLEFHPARRDIQLVVHDQGYSRAEDGATPREAVRIRRKGS